MSSQREACDRTLELCADAGLLHVGSTVTFMSQVVHLIREDLRWVHLKAALCPCLKGHATEKKWGWGGE